MMRWGIPQKNSKKQLVFHLPHRTGVQGGDELLREVRANRRGQADFRRQRETVRVILMALFRGMGELTEFEPDFIVGRVKHQDFGR